MSDDFRNSANQSLAPTVHPEARPATRTTHDSDSAYKEWDLSDWPLLDSDRYQVSREYARGGIGRILLARDKRLDRIVAVKVLIDPDSRAEARFFREALLTARLQHPAIVPVHDAGRSPEGKPLYAMKLISGRSLAVVIDEARTLMQRLAILPNLVAVADAMAYAHAQKVIHRDLKPSNVLVGPFGETMVIDWGLAADLSGKTLSAEEVATPYQMATLGVTAAGTVLGTPPYMPPEQATGRPVDERADVYSLGAILYHLLCGSPPFGGASSAEMLKKIRTESPVPLEQRQTDVPRELAAIVRKAMSHNPNQRYATAKELSEDLKRFQTGQLVAAHSYSAWMLFGRWLHRYRAAALVAAVLLAVLAATATLSVQRIVGERNRADHQRAEAERALTLAEARNDELQLAQARGMLDRDPTLALALLKTFPNTARHWGAVREIAADAVSRGVARHQMDHQSTVVGVAFSPDGKLLASASFDQTVAIWEVASARKVGSLQHDAQVVSMAFSPDGEQIASGDRDGTIRLWSLSRDRHQKLIGHKGPIRQVLFSPDGGDLASVGADGTVRLWDLAQATGRIVMLYPNSTRAIAFSRDGEILASGGEDGVVRGWRRSSQRTFLASRLGRRINAIAISPDAKWIAACGQDKAIRLGT